MELKPSVNLRKYIDYALYVVIGLCIGGFFFPSLILLAECVAKGVAVVVLADYWWIETGDWEKLKEDFKVHFMK